MQTQERITDSLRKEIESRDSELSVLREKGNSLTVAIADLRKQLTVREQELQLAKREAKSTLRYYHYLCTYMYIRVPKFIDSELDDGCPFERAM